MSRSEGNFVPADAPSAPAWIACCLPQKLWLGQARFSHPGRAQVRGVRVLSCASGELGRWVERGDANATIDEIPMSSTVSGAVHDHNPCGCRQLSRRRRDTRQARHDSASAVQRRGARDRARLAGQSRSRRSSSARAVLAALHLDSTWYTVQFLPTNYLKLPDQSLIGQNTKSQSLPGKT
jgi:hypothetical protein